MIRHRVSIAGLMVAIAVVALGILGLKEGTAPWAAGTFTLTVLILLGAIVSTVHSRGVERASWFGFALFGWVYLIGTFGPLSDTGVKTPPMLTASLLDQLDPLIHPAPQYIPNPQYQGNPLTFVASSFVSPTIIKPGTVFWQGNRVNYLQIGHCLGAVLFGCLGALWSRVAYARRHRRADEPNTL
jgi:hypothetical protein